MGDEWGSVDGDINAAAIMSDRRAESKVGDVVAAITFLGLVAAAVWYARSDSSAALATSLVLAALFIRTGVAVDAMKTHTFVMIAERRAQLLEQRVQAMQVDAMLQRP